MSDVEPRKATEVLLDLEAKIEVLTSMIRSNDHLIKVLLNKVSTLTTAFEKAQVPSVPPAPILMPTISAVDSAPKNLIRAEDRIAVEEAPVGFRRTSRPETFDRLEGDGAFTNKPKGQKGPQMPVQLPKMAEMTVPAEAIKKKAENAVPIPATPPPPIGNPKPNENLVLLSQRVTDSAGKSLFLANVEVIDGTTKNTVGKLRTGATGKFSISLPPGSFKILVNKADSQSKKKMESIQDVVVDGSKPTIELPALALR